MKLKIAVCDDAQEQIEYLSGVISAWANKKRHVAEVKRYLSAKSFLFDYAEEKDFDILLLDIEMPEKFETASPAFCFMKNDGFRKSPARNCRSKTPAWQWQSAQNRRFFWNIHFFRNMPSAAPDAAGDRMLQRQKRKC